MRRKHLSGCGEVWYRAWMGFKRPRVRISTLGPKKQKQLLLFLLFSLCRDSNTSCNTPGECCSRRLDGAKQLFLIPNGIENVSESRHSASQPGNIYSVKQAQKIQNNFCCLFSMEGFEKQIQRGWAPPPITRQSRTIIFAAGKNIDKSRHSEQISIYMYL